MSCYESQDCIRLQCTALAVLPVCFGLSIVRETDNELEVIITDADGRAINIGADTVSMTVKTEVNGDLVFSKINGPGSHSRPDLGQTIFQIDKADTTPASDSAMTRWVYEISRTEASGNERVHIVGDFSVRPRI